MADEHWPVPMLGIPAQFTTGSKSLNKVNLKEWLSIGSKDVTLLVQTGENIISFIELEHQKYWF